jgi:hypothetical protein
MPPNNHSRRLEVPSIVNTITLTVLDMTKQQPKTRLSVSLRNFFSSLEEETKSTESIENNTAIEDSQSSSHSSFWKRWNNNPETMTAKCPDHEDDLSIESGEKGVVSFAPLVQVRPIPSVLDYTEEEQDAIWYTSQD